MKLLILAFGTLFTVALNLVNFPHKLLNKASDLTPQQLADRGVEPNCCGGCGGGQGGHG